ncbi:hypothetical protein [Galbitalea soli]|uniref:PKD domain-containing protein n=1 Tax=Galbitalea soli TaxID=1268042 RepID=A0A7C9PM01_9MICO|nr:hypothetical protein [Galbitalea soli]NEM90565.1 hypothetical protein [Galbitalea soli]NYJ31280.1 hypothetical protein [Galbitalea soli]
MNACPHEQSVDFSASKSSGGQSGSQRSGGSAVPPSPTPSPTPTDWTQVATEYAQRNDIWVTSPFTLHDLRSFHPTRVHAQSEPGFWAAVGIPTNYFVDGAPQLRHGRLLGKPIDVRFTPREFEWHYGDGEVATVREAGASWEALDLPDLTTTATSHVYRARGSVTTTVTVHYAVSYRYDGSDWIDVDGTVEGPATPITQRVYLVRTVLVHADCVTDPSGPGC